METGNDLSSAKSLREGQVPLQHSTKQQSSEQEEVKYPQSHRNLKKGIRKIVPLSLNGRSAWRSGLASNTYQFSRLKCASSPGPNNFPELSSGFHTLSICVCLANHMKNYRGKVHTLNREGR